MPNIFSDITSCMERKIEIMRLYETETQPGPLPGGYLPSALWPAIVERRLGSSMPRHLC